MPKKPADSSPPRPCFSIALVLLAGVESALPTQIDVMNSTGDETLTLVTCVPDSVYTHRLIVTAKRN